MEEWRPVVGYEDMYEVSSEGRVRRLDHISQGGHFLKKKILKAGPNKQGYNQVGIHGRDGRRGRKTYVHLLVLWAFQGPPKPGEQARHVVTNDKSVNTVWNLAWGTQEDNEKDKERHGTNHRIGGLNKGQHCEPDCPCKRHKRNK
jgi:hypothetical protein